MTPFQEAALQINEALTIIGLLACAAGLILVLVIGYTHRRND